MVDGPLDIPELSSQEIGLSQAQIQAINSGKGLLDEGTGQIRDQRDIIQSGTGFYKKEAGKPVFSEIKEVPDKKDLNRRIVAEMGDHWVGVMDQAVNEVQQKYKLSDDDALKLEKMFLDEYKDRGNREYLPAQFGLDLNVHSGAAASVSSFVSGLETMAGKIQKIENEKKVINEKIVEDVATKVKGAINQDVKIAEKGKKVIEKSLDKALTALTDDKATAKKIVEAQDNWEKVTKKLDAEGVELPQNVKENMTGVLLEGSKRTEAPLNESVAQQAKRLNLSAEAGQPMAPQVKVFPRTLTEAEVRLQQQETAIGLQQADRVQRAMRGDLPASVGLQQQAKKQFELIKENIARSGGRITGDSLETAVANTTPGQQALDNLREQLNLRRDEENRAVVATEVPQVLGRTQVFSNLTGQQYNRNLGYEQQAYQNTLGFYGQNPATQYYDLLTGAPNPASLAGGGYLQAGQAYGQAAAPYTAERYNRYQADVANAQARQQFYGQIGQLTGLIGSTAIMAAAGPAAPGIAAANVAAQGANAGGGPITAGLNHVPVSVGNAGLNDTYYVPPQPKQYFDLSPR